MSDSEEELLLLLLLRRRYRKKRKYWVHPFSVNNLKYSSNMKKLKNRGKFQSFYRMSRESFEVLLYLVGNKLQKRDTNFRKAITPKEKLLITLRYLATGSSYSSLHFEFMRGRSTIGEIISETTAVIWEILQPIFMPIPTKTMWQKYAERYYNLYQLPNCVGSLDGKHFRIKKLPKTGSLYFNYKGFFSIVLMATADADGLFITVDVGEVGRNIDGGVFQHSALGKALRENKLDLPPRKMLPNDLNDFEFPFYFAADEAFPLGENIIKPFPQKMLTNVKRIFNYRLSRGRKSIECAFGMLVSKFRAFETALCSKEETIINVIKAACVLHNFIRTREGRFTNRNLELNSVQIGATHLPNLELLPTTTTQRNLNQSQINRNYLANYFIKSENALPWQWKYGV